MHGSRRNLLLGGAAAIGASALAMVRGGSGRAASPPSGDAAFAVRHSDGEWRALLGPARYDVLRCAGTELPFSSPLDHETRSGRYDCAGCDHPLFLSSTKFDSGTGWPSFFEPLPGAVDRSDDRSMLLERTEIHCARCGGHLGHVFADGPPPTGLRYCMNGVALLFKPTSV